MHTNTPRKAQTHRESTLLPNISKHQLAKSQKTIPKHSIIERVGKLLPDELQKEHILKISHDQNDRHRQVPHKQYRNKQNIDTNIKPASILTKSDIKQSKSSSKIQVAKIPEKKKSMRELYDRYAQNQRLSKQLKLPRNDDDSLYSDDEDIKEALIKEDQYKTAQPMIYVLTKKPVISLSQRQRLSQGIFYTENPKSASRMEIKQNHVETFPLIQSQGPSKQPILAIPKQERYIKQKLVGQQAVNRFYNRYKNIEKVRQMEHFRLQFHPITAILTILEHYNIPPKRMQLIKVKGEEALLDLKNCGLGYGVSIKAVAQILQKVQVFQQVDLSNNSIHPDLCEVIIPHLSRMRSINLAYNKIGRHGVELLTKIIYDQSRQEQECQLEQLNLQSNNIHDSAIGTMFTSLAHVNKLLILHLSKNLLGNFAAARLKQFLQGDNMLNELYLHWCQLGMKATKMIFQGLSKNKNLKVLDLSWNQIGLDGVPAFCNFLKNNDRLVHLDVSYCEIDQIDTNIISKAIRNNHSIYGIHYQGNMGYVDFKGYLHQIDKQNKYTPLSIRAGLVQRINSINIVKEAHTNTTIQTAYYRNICWICQGWEEKYFKINKQNNDKVCFIHFQFERFAGVLMTDKGSYFEIMRMCPPAQIKFFITKVSRDNIFSHTYNMQQAGQIKVYDYKDTVNDFKIEQKIFRQIYLQTINMIAQPKYYTQIFNEDFQTKMHCIPRADDPKPNNDLFKKKPQDPQPTPIKKKKKKIVPVLLKEIEVKDVPQQFDNMFNRGTGSGEDINSFIAKSVDFDMRHSKVSKIVRSRDQLMEVRSILVKNYDLFQKIYYYLINNNPNINGVYSISQHRFQKFIEEQNYQTRRVTKAKIRLKLVGCLSNTGGTELDVQGFYRPQFFEFLLRLGMEKYCVSMSYKEGQNQNQKKKRQKYPLSISDAFARILKSLKKYQYKADTEQWRQQNLATYEMNTVLKSYSIILQIIYQKYAGMTQKHMNTKTKKKLLLDEFKMIFIFADVRKTREALKDLQLAYRTTKKAEIQDGIADTGLDYVEFLQTFCRFAEGLHLRPIGSQTHQFHVLWQKQVIQPDQVPLFLKVQRLIADIYDKNYDLHSKKLSMLFQHGLFPEEVDILMHYFKQKHDGQNQHNTRRIMLTRHIKMNSLLQHKNNKITLSFLIDLLKIKALHIQEQNKRKLIEAQEHNAFQSDEQHHTDRHTSEHKHHDSDHHHHQKRKSHHQQKIDNHNH